MASSTLSSFTTSCPSLSQRTSYWVRTPRPNSISMRTNFSNNSIRSMAADGTDNLDHLQRTTRPQQAQSKKRTPQSAPIGLWDRFPNVGTVQQMMETMDRLMEDPLSYNTTWTGSSVPRGKTPWEIKEFENEYKIRFDIPGMTKKDVKMWVEDKMLVLKAEKAAKENGEDENGEEWSPKSYGKYNTRIALPENVEFEKIKAEVRDGVLYIAIPKLSAQGKILDINVQ